MRFRSSRLQDVFDAAELNAFFQRVGQQVQSPNWIVEPKVDGLSVALEYVDGVLSAVRPAGMAR